MESSEKKISFPLYIAGFTAIFFAPLSFIFNLISYLSTAPLNMLLHAWANLIILVPSIVVAIILVYVLNKKNKLNSKFWINIFICAFAYFLAFFIINTMAYSGNDLNNLWTLYTLIVLLCASILIFPCINFVPTSLYFLKASVNFVIISAAFVLITFVIAELGEGNSGFIISLVFTLVYWAFAVGYFFIKKAIEGHKNKSKEYKSQF